ncbi:P-loop containing nucleoside triphosphate hydrolase protein [Mollisia scopiformis]|uniref:p-loop containing nucleoside triphosphate hydrolase protein n=1 Tax=Mollisia scopiformis TaxID=149040 RepID=A0A132B969_MOLSC|nr:P-loop containing nucleoside triphosphate hydrolase protein [Mollisia scopiformis]KUJ08921.1 P-loop containing nucleoside triphosphate hydrolase protein [Mollisia scopiformis]
MIDQRTYNKLHPNSATFLFSKDPILPYDEYPLEIELDADLPDLDYMLCPHIVQGFFLKEKHWVSLYVRKVEPVNWNKEAFDRLVLPPKTKELIKALLLTNEGRVSDPVGVCGGKRQDLIAGKGTGLIVLLHGGPGTGKTLTAESVAELAEKPLYSVTCGDIGTEPDAVESYLRRVLYFGKTWNCVLLLDEADVFLEERGLQDLKRNSLVSIFLRILEYYSGILILTSNRVGTFDEAFRSRIQLALRYPDPDPPFRKKIWRNFFDMLEADEEDADLDELKEHIEELSDLDMNGREIRNALTTARQLALYKKKTLGWVHLSQAVNAARDFNKYLMDVQGHSNKDWAREISLR